MENKVVGYIPRLLFKIYLSLKERFDPTLPIPEEEKITVEICKKLIVDPESKLTFAPISGKRFIKNENKNMFVVIESHTINLINHVYSYSVYLSSQTDYKEIIQSFDGVLENKRQLLEDEIRSNIQHSLQTILKKLD
jgi:hypothetical protein